MRERKLQGLEFGWTNVVSRDAALSAETAAFFSAGQRHLEPFSSEDFSAQKKTIKKI